MTDLGGTASTTTRRAHLADDALVPPRALVVHVVDQHELVRTGVAAALGAAGLAARASADPPARAPAGADLVLVDPAQLGHASALTDLVAAMGPMPVVALTWQDDEAALYDALRAGVRAYLLKSVTAPSLADALELVHRGSVVVDPSLATQAVLASAQRGPHDGWPGAAWQLTERESQVLVLLADGRSNREIADALYLGEETVRSHLRSLYRKLDVRDRAEAIAFAFRNRLVG